LYKKWLLFLVILGIVWIFSCGANAGYLHTSGNQILDANGNKASLSGVSWFGFETSNYCPHGLWTQPMSFFLDTVKSLGFNHLRVPYCNQMFDSGSAPNSIDAVKNPDLAGLTGIQIMDKLVAGCKSRGLRIYLDRHRPDSGGQSALWYTSAYDETRWINDWKMLASRYKGDDTVMGCDLHNEPHSPANWGSGSTANDWRLAAERCGNAILSVNPDLLIIVEGIDSYNGNGYWWGGNLMGAQNYPVRLNVANRLVYSAHDYGPGVASQSWFSDPSFPGNMPGIWDKYWGYLHKNGIAPVLIGEFGGRSTDTSSVEGKWQNGLVSYIKSNGLHWTYWCLNPNSGDTGGILNDNWSTVNQGKMNMLKPAMYGMISSGGGTVTPTPARTTPTPVRVATPTPVYTGTPTLPVGTPVRSTPTPIGGGQPTPTTPPGAGVIKVQFYNQGTAAINNQIYVNFKLVNTGSGSVNLANTRIRYYYTVDGAKPQTFYCDYTSLGASNVNGTFISMSPAKTGADTYLEVGFGSAAGNLSPGASVTIQGRFAKNDWSNYTQTNDYSFNSSATSYVDWNKVTGYVSGTLIWGTEP
jgi:endoglucanase